MLIVASPVAGYCKRRRIAKPLNLTGTQFDFLPGSSDAFFKGSPGFFIELFPGKNAIYRQLKIGSRYDGARLKCIVLERI